MSHVKACFQTEAEILNEFRRLVAAKYGRLYGVLHKEFTIAIKKRIEELKKSFKINKEVSKLRCPNCGGKMRYNPAGQFYHCCNWQLVVAKKLP